MLSAGQFLVGYPGATVVTVFAGIPDRPRLLTSYDSECGFVSARQAMLARSIENDKALAEVGAVGRSLPFLDHQYRDPIDPTWLAGEISGALVELVAETGATRLIAPLGLAHPDHEITAEACRRALVWRPEVEGFAYEDLPSRILWPEMVAPALARWHDEFMPSLEFIGTGALVTKERAVKRYRSQLGALAHAGATMNVLLCPERFWSMRPCA